MPGRNRRLRPADAGETRGLSIGAAGIVITASALAWMDYLGVGIGAGLGGASVALADAGTISLEVGLAGAFAIGIVAAVLLALVARRLPDARYLIERSVTMRRAGRASSSAPCSTGRPTTACGPRHWSLRGKAGRLITAFRTSDGRADDLERMGASSLQSVPQPGWQDMSRYAVHFTKPWGDGDEYSRLWKIVSSGELIPGPHPFGAGRQVSGVAALHRAVCFSETPLDLLRRIVRRRSPYGIAFTKEFLVRQGGAPVWYLDKGGGVASIVTAWTAQHVDAPEHPLWRLMPFVDFPGEYGSSSYRFEWEREWRVPGGFAFDSTDIEFLFLPEKKHSTAKRSTYRHLQSRLIDPYWPAERIYAKLPAPRLDV